MSLAGAVAEFLVAWNDELPRKQLTPFVAAMLAEMTPRKRGPKPKESLRETVAELVAEGKSASRIREQTGASFGLIRSVRAEINK